MSTALVFQQRPEFVESGWRLFDGRLTSMRESIIKKKGFAAADAAALAHDRNLFPIQASHCVNGAPRWSGSEAERFLKIDLDNEHKSYWTPKMLFVSRAEYQVFELKVFRKHIDQERQSQKDKSNRFKKVN